MALGGGEAQLKELRSSDNILILEDIAAGVLELIEDNTQVGAIMSITVKDGRAYVSV